MSSLRQESLPDAQHHLVEPLAQPIRLLIVDDHPVIRQGIQKILEASPDITIVDEAKTGRQAVLLATLLQPDVILMDIVMPEMEGLEAIAQIHATLPDIHILVFTSFSMDKQIFSVLKAGALGYILKGCSSEELIAAIRQVAAGEASLDPSIARKVVREFVHPAKRAQPEHALTQQEEKVLNLLARGLSNKQIASDLVISEKTVRDHVSSILAKLRLANRTQAALFALRHGLTSPESDG